MHETNIFLPNVNDFWNRRGSFNGSRKITTPIVSKENSNAIQKYFKYLISIKKIPHVAWKEI